MTERHTDTRPNHSGFFSEIIRIGLLVLLIVLPIRLFIAQPFIVSGASMEPTFDSGDYLIIDQLSYRFEKPERKSVVVFRYPDDPDKFFIKRVIGLPGETVKIDGSTVTIINDKHPNGMTLSEPYVAPENTDGSNLTVTLGDNEYFVLGDNRDSSSDSRTWGTLPDRYLIGRAFLQLLPPSEATLTPGYDAALTAP